MRKYRICIIVSLFTIFLAGCGHSGDAIDNHSDLQSEGSAELKKSVEKAGNSQDVKEECVEDTQESTEDNVRIVVKNIEGTVRQSKDAAGIQMKRIEQTYHDDNGNELVETVFEYPQLTIDQNKELEENLNQYFQQEQKNLTKTAQQLRQYAQQDREIMSEDELNYWDPYNASEKSSIMRNDSAVLSIVTRYDEYDGRDSAFVEKKTMNYDVKKNQSLTIQDVIKDTDEFYEAVKNYCNQESDDTDMSYYAGSILGDDNWYLGTDGIGIFTDYLVADADGTEPEEIQIPYEKLQEYLKEEYLPK